MKTIKLPHYIGDNKKLSNTLFYVVVAILVFIYLIFEPSFMSLDQVKKIIGAYDSKAVVYLVSFIIMLLCALTPLPAELVALANAFVFSPLEAFLLTWLSAVLSAHIGYELGRLNWFNPCESGNEGKICRWLHSHGYKALAIMRLIPIVPFFALNICGGIFKLNRGKYLVITAICIIPAVILLTLFPRLFMQS